MGLRQITVLAVLVLLSACNVAMSDKPLFAEDRRSSRLLLEDGIWTLAKDECVANLSKPRTDWPSCVDWVIISHNKAVLGSDSNPDEGAEDVFIVDGKPPLLQARVTSKGDAPFYAYLVFRPAVVSPAGRVSTAEVWTVACGTPEPGNASKINPYPGFTEHCRTTSIAALRAAANRERPQSNDIATWKWLRAEKP